jgi:hypothetical protein
MNHKPCTEERQIIQWPDEPQVMNRRKTDNTIGNEPQVMNRRKTDNTMGK